MYIMVINVKLQEVMLILHVYCTHDAFLPYLSGLARVNVSVEGSSYRR